MHHLEQVSASLFKSRYRIRPPGECTKPQAESDHQNDRSRTGKLSVLAVEENHKRIELLLIAAVYDRLDKAT